MTGDLRGFKDELRDELVAAAYRERAARRATARSPRPVQRRWKPSPVLLATTAAMVMLGALATTTLLPADPAGADVFAITVIEDRVELAVIDIVVDPGAVVEQVADEAGVDAELVAVPVVSALEGEILGTASRGGEVAPELTRDANGVISHITLPAGFDGKLYIEYGRKAEPGELYRYPVTDESCARLWGQTPAESRAEVDELAASVIYEQVNASEGAGVPFSDLAPDSQLVEIFYVSDDTIIVTYASDIDRQPRHPACEVTSG
jgi:hypothetical protein